MSVGEPNHPDTERLLAFSQGRVSTGDLAAIQSHLDSCAACCESLTLLADDDPFVARLRRVKRDASADTPSPASRDAVGGATPRESSLSSSFARLGTQDVAAGHHRAVPTVPGYDIGREIGRGGMGVVYQARQLGLHRVVALKVLLAGSHAGPDDLARFRSEAETVAQLRHENVVQVHDIGSHNGLPYFALEFCGGGSLAARTGGQPQAPRDAARLVEALARGVHAAHVLGIIHRDLKPANVLLTIEGTPKITDFGLAKWLEHDAGLTGTNAVVGTPSYMAPEQAAGKSRNVGPAADVYALGAILYELLTGRPPFKAKTPLDTLHLVVHAEAPSVTQLQPHMPRDLAVIAMKCLEKASVQRYASAQALADDLHRFLDGRPIQARAVGRVERVRRWAARNPVVAGLTAGLFVALVVGIAGVSWKWREAESRRQEADDERGRVIVAQKETTKERNDAQEMSAGMRLDKGIDLADRGEVGAGLHWMLEAARTAPGGAADLRRVADLNLAAWLGQTPALRHVIALPPGTNSAALHPDGKQLAVGGEGPDVSGRVHWLDTATQAPLRPAWTAVAHLGGVMLSRDGRRLLSMAYPGDMNLRTQCWDVELNRPLTEPLRGPVCWPAFRADGAVWAGAETGCIRLRDCATGNIAKEIRVDGNPTRLALSPDGSKLVVATGTRKTLQPGTARIWDLATGQTVGDPLHHDGAIQAVEFSPDSRCIATASWDRTVRRWDATTGKPIGAPLFHPAGVVNVVFSPDGRTLIAHDEVHGLSSWEAATGQRLSGVVPRLTSAAPEQSANSKYLLTVADFGQSPEFAKQCTHAEIWQAARSPYGPIPLGDLLRERRQNPNRPREVTVFSPDGSTAILTNTEGWIRLINVPSGKPRCRPVRHPWPVESSVFSPDGKLVAVASHAVHGNPANLCEVLQVDTGQPVCPPLPHTSWVRSLAFSLDGKTLMTGGLDHQVHFWDPATGQEVGSPLRLNGNILRIGLHPDGRTLTIHHFVEASGNYCIALWDVITRAPKGTPIPGEAATVFQFSPDSKTLLTIKPGDDVYRLWDTTTGVATGVVLPTERGRFPQARFTPDGKTVATGSTDGTVRLWDAATGKQIGKPMLHTSSVRELAFSPDPEGEFLLVGYQQCSFRLWHRTTGRPIGPFLWHHSSLTACAFTLDGLSIVTASEDGAVRTWPAPLRWSDDGDLDLERLRLRLELRTGLTLRDGTVEHLLPDEWQGRRRRLTDLEGSVESAYAGFLDDRAWHDRQARDAELDGDTFAALWHLDQLLEATEQQGGPSDKGSPTHSGAWVERHTRRMSLLASAGRFQEAEADYALAKEFGDRKALSDFRDHSLAVAESGGQWSTALWYLNHALADETANWQLYRRRAAVLAKLGRDEQSRKDVESAIAYGADVAFVLAVAQDDARNGRWELAAERFARAAGAGPLPLSTWHQRALVDLRRGDHTAYRRLCNDLIAKLGTSTSPASANLGAWICVLGSDGPSDPAAAVKLAETAIQGLRGEAPQGRHDMLNTLGAALFRAGRFREAIDRLQQGIKSNDGKASLSDWVFLAMAHHRLGETAAANASWEHVKTWTPPRDGNLWPNLEAELLHREAAALLTRP